MKKRLKFLKITKQGWFQVESVSKTFIAQEMPKRWKRDFREKMCFLSINSLQILKSTKLANFFLDCVSDCHFEEEFLKRSKIGVFGIIARIVWKKIPAFFERQSFWLKLYRMRLKWYYCLRILKKFEFWAYCKIHGCFWENTR